MPSLVFLHKAHSKAQSAEILHSWRQRADYVAEVNSTLTEREFYHAIGYVKAERAASAA